MSEKVKHAIFLCEKHGQEHLIKYMKPVFSEKSARFAESVISTDFAGIEKLYKTVTLKEEKGGTIPDILPQKVFDFKNASSSEKKELVSLGIKALSEGEVAALTMAGGQGTRLGHKGPKGTFILPSNPPESLFAIQAKSLCEIERLSGGCIPWLIMTSHENHDETVEYFRKNNSFGYNPALIKFFRQEMIPLIDFNGKVLVRDNEIAMGPNGNGGVFSSMKKEKVIEWLRGKGIKKLFICGIDNALVKMADPKFIGFSVSYGKGIVCKSAKKRSWDESAGVYCRRNNRPYYMEYTELSESNAKLKDESNNLVFGDIGIVMYVYDMDVIEKISLREMPYHEARKKIPYTEPSGETVFPENINGIKYETFIFDSFEYVTDIGVMRVLREEEFAPVKNSEGQDSPETAANLYNRSKEKITE